MAKRRTSGVKAVRRKRTGAATCGGTLTRGLWRSVSRILLLFGVAALLGSVAMMSFIVPSRSMADTLLPGDYTLVNRLAYGLDLPGPTGPLVTWRKPRTNQLVVFRLPSQGQRFYVKRCVAIGGQAVEIRNKVLYVDGNRQPDPQFSKYVDAHILTAVSSPRDHWGPAVVPSGHIFVLGDNRDNSRDSRHFGPLDARLVIGRARVVYWSRDTGGDSSIKWLSRVRWSRLGKVLQ